MAEPVHMQCMEVWGGNQLVDTAVTLPGLDAWVYSKPHDADSGGDVHYVSSCATGRITRLLLADVSGHGSAVASTAVELRTLMRRFVNHIDQTRFVRSLNEQFSSLAKAGTFATAVVTTFFAPTRRLSLCNAGHPPPLFYRAATNEWSLLDEESLANIPLGIEDTEYQQFEVKMELGDWVLCYTDALFEAMSSDGSMLAARGLLEVVRNVSMDDVVRFVPKLLEAISLLHAGNLSEDDVTVLMFRANDSESQAPLSERLLAPFRISRAFVSSLRGIGNSAWPDLRVANVLGAFITPFSRLWR
jgi:phosphoserine phosphatase RsbU/P